MEKTAASPDDYLSSLEEPSRSAMQLLDGLISAELAGRPRTLWTGTMWGGTDQSIVGYGDLEQRGGGKVVPWFVVGLAQQKAHLSVYVSAVEDGRTVAEAYKDRLGKVKVGRSSISFRRPEDVNLDVLREVVRTAARLAPGD